MRSAKWHSNSVANLPARRGASILDNFATLPEFALEPRRFFLVVFDNLLGLFR